MSGRVGSVINQQNGLPLLQKKRMVYRSSCWTLRTIHFLAVGTSLPELATSAIAAYKKQSDIAIGNVIGSNIFNIFFILGTSAVIRPLPFSSSSNSDIAMTIFASLMLFLVMFVGKKRIIEKWQGAVMVTSYIGYVVFLILTK